MKVRLFARLREITGSAELLQEVPDGSDAARLWEHLVRQYPGLAPYRPSVSCAVNEDYARFTTPLKDGDEVAFLPPVSGGGNIVDCGLRIEDCGLSIGLP